jgi:hypothetical protein
MKIKSISLKTQNLPLTISYCALLYALFLITTIGTNNLLYDIQKYFEYFNSSKFIVALAPIVFFILLNVLPVNIKEKIAHFRTKNPLPGTRVFTKLIKNDDRIDCKRLKKKIGNFPTIPKEQNSLWYSLYCQVKDQIEVKIAHKNYLLARDLSFLSFQFFLLVSIFFLIKFQNTNIITFIISICSYGILITVCNNVGNRFTLTVLSQFLNKKNRD